MSTLQFTRCQELRLQCNDVISSHCFLCGWSFLCWFVRCTSCDGGFCWLCGEKIVDSHGLPPHFNMVLTEPTRIWLTQLFAAESNQRLCGQAIRHCGWRGAAGASADTMRNLLGIRCHVHMRVGPRSHLCCIFTDFLSANGCDGNGLWMLRAAFPSHARRKLL